MRSRSFNSLKQTYGEISPNVTQLHLNRAKQSKPKKGQHYDKTSQGLPIVPTKESSQGLPSQSKTKTASNLFKNDIFNFNSAIAKFNDHRKALNFAIEKNTRNF